MKAKKNPLVVLLSLLALLFMYFTFTVHWTFLIAAAILSATGWKILLKKN